jgi:hypothetical protein
MRNLTPFREWGFLGPIQILRGKTFSRLSDVYLRDQPTSADPVSRRFVPPASGLGCYQFGELHKDMGNNKSPFHRLWDQQAALSVLRSAHA